MRPLKSAFGVVGALIPVVYLGGLFFYFFGITRSGVGPIPGSVMMPGLAPTLLGLGALATLFCIPLLLKLIRAVTASDSPRPDRSAGWDAQADEAASDFDPDAVIARYLERRAAGTDGPQPSPPLPEDGGATPRPGFGRKIS